MYISGYRYITRAVIVEETMRWIVKIRLSSILREYKVFEEGGRKDRGIFFVGCRLLKF